jgi:hypothetical protein
MPPQSAPAVQPCPYASLSAARWRVTISSRAWRFASIRHVGVSREHGVRDVPSDAHDHLVPRARLAHDRKASLTAMTPPPRRRRHPVYRLAVTRGPGTPGAQTGPFLAWDGPRPRFGVCWEFLAGAARVMGRHGALPVTL